MPIGNVWIISVTACLFVCLCVCMCVCVCTVTDFSAEDKASGVKFCMVVQLGRESRRDNVLLNC